MTWDFIQGRVTFLVRAASLVAYQRADDAHRKAVADELTDELDDLGLA